MIKTLIKIFIKTILLIFFATAMFFVFSKFFSLMSFTDPQMPLEKGSIIKLKAQKTLTQEFMASHDNLVNIKFLLRIESVDDTSTVKMQLADETCSNIIREGSLSQSSFLTDDNLVEFKFDMISDSNGKTFCVKAIFDTQDLQASPILFFSRDNDSTTLSVRPVYENSNWQEDVSELNQRISQYKPWFLKHFYLYTISFLFLLLSFLIVVILILA
jgi:hypothetical protein